MREELKSGNRSIFSYSLQNALKNLKEQGKQGILFVNRRGHSTFVSCRSCGFVLECPHCDVSLSYHYTHAGATELLRCHYCNFTQVQPRHCPSCESPYLKFFGSGTQKVTEALTDQFPELSWLRFDSDTTRTKGAHRRILDDFSQGKADLLVGTQMLTKGLDVAQVTLVGAIAADSLLNFSDYRSAERAFQTLTQVAGRAGRGDEAGKVIIQTYSPTHPVIEAVKNHDYQAFVDQELPQRQALNYPPYGHLILIRLSGLDSELVENAAVAIAQKCQVMLGEQVETLGPAPASVMRVAKRFRWHILLKFSDNLIQNLDLKELRVICPASVSLSIDVDPLYIE
jgi:primosomal protein N' (replication factor Y)